VWSHFNAARGRSRTLAPPLHLPLGRYLSHMTGLLSVITATSFDRAIDVFLSVSRLRRWIIDIGQIAASAARNLANSQKPCLFSFLLESFTDGAYLFVVASLPGRMFIQPDVFDSEPKNALRGFPEPEFETPVCTASHRPETTGISRVEYVRFAAMPTVLMNLLLINSCMTKFYLHVLSTSHQNFYPQLPLYDTVHVSIHSTLETVCI